MKTTRAQRVRAVLGVAIILGVLASVFYIHTRPARNGYGAEHDFVTVIAGSHCLADRCDPYDSPTLEREFVAMGGYAPKQHFKPEWPVYPPSTLLLLYPLSLMTWPVFSVIWILICFGFVAAAFLALFLACRAYRDLLSLLPFAILLADGSIAWAVELGQPVLVAASSLCLAILALEAFALPITGTLLLAISLLIKPQVAWLCVAYFLLKRTTRLPAIAACLATGAMAAAGTLAFYSRLSSLAWLGHLAANLKMAVKPGGDADFSLLNHDSASYLNIQAFLARMIDNPRLCNDLTYAVCTVIGSLLIFVCWRRKNLQTRPFTILAVLIMLELLVSYHRLYDHILILSAIPSFYEIRARSRKEFLWLAANLFVYHFSQFHGLKIHGYGPFSSGPPVELFVSGLCLKSLWQNKPCAASTGFSAPGLCLGQQRLIDMTDGRMRSPVAQAHKGFLEEIVRGG
jgi:hypothetical protein